MSGKPRFRDFVGSLRLRDVEDEYVCIEETEAGKRIFVRTKGMVALSIINAVMLFFVGFASVLRLLIFPDFWPQLVFDIPLAAYLAVLVFYFIFYRKIEFKEVSEEIWLKSRPHCEDGVQNADIKKTKKQHMWKWIIAMVFVSAILFAFLNSFTFNYLEYIIEGGDGAVEVQAAVGAEEYSPYPPLLAHDADTSDIILSDSGQPQTLLLESEKQWWKIDVIFVLVKLPGEVSVFVNGEKTDTDCEYETNYFWDEDYFKREVYAFSYISNLHEGENLIEMKSGGFYKAWTFILEYK